jgi:hypothetical protein
MPSQAAHMSTSSTASTAGGSRVAKRDTLSDGEHRPPAETTPALRLQRPPRVQRPPPVVKRPTRYGPPRRSQPPAGMRITAPDPRASLEDRPLLSPASSLASSSRGASGVRARFPPTAPVTPAMRPNASAMKHSTTPQPTTPRLRPKVSFLLEAPAARGQVMTLPKGHCLHLNGAGFYWQQAEEPIVGPLFVRGGQPQPEDAIKPLWSRADDLTVVAQALARQAPAYLAARFVPRGACVVVREYIRDGDAELAQHALINPRIWAPRGFIWRRSAAVVPEVPGLTPTWPAFWRQAYMQSHGGPDSLLIPQSSSDVFFWALGNPGQTGTFGSQVSRQERAAVLSALFEAGEAVVVHTKSTAFAVLGVERTASDFRLRLLRADGVAMIYPAPSGWQWNAPRFHGFTATLGLPEATARQ